MIDIIIKKRNGLELSGAELTFTAGAAANAGAPDYQLSAFLMACFLKGLTPKETALFTKAMAETGGKLLFKTTKPVADKHSTGGVGDGISLALAPLAAAAGLAVPMMSGRGLGHTGGTLDKLESIPGFKINLTEKQIYKQMKELGVCLFGQTKNLAPADKKLYALRDATGTVESLPLITASILSKKYAEGAKVLVMDVKYGSGAFMPQYKQAEALAKSLVKTGRLLGLKITAVLTDMDQPLGRAVGNANEMRQSIAVLKGDKTTAPDFYALLIETCALMLVSCGKAKNMKAARKRTEGLLSSGAAAELFRKIIKAQGGDARVMDAPERLLKDARFSAQIKADAAGFIHRLDARTAGKAAVILGAGRDKMEDKVDAGAGFWLEKKRGDKVAKGSVIATAYASDKKKLAAGTALFKTAVEIKKAPPQKQKLIKRIIWPEAK